MDANWWSVPRVRGQAGYGECRCRIPQRREPSKRWGTTHRNRRFRNLGAARRRWFLYEGIPIATFGVSTCATDPKPNSSRPLETMVERSFRPTGRRLLLCRIVPGGRKSMLRTPTDPASLNLGRWEICSLVRSDGRRMRNTWYSIAVRTTIVTSVSWTWLEDRPAGSSMGGPTLRRPPIPGTGNGSTSDRIAAACPRFGRCRRRAGRRFRLRGKAAGPRRNLRTAARCTT